MMKLRIQTLTGQSKEVEADPKNTILDLKFRRRVDGKVDPDINRTKWVVLGESGAIL